MLSSNEWALVLIYRGKYNYYLEKINLNGKNTCRF